MASDDNKLHAAGARKIILTLMQKTPPLSRK